MPILDSIADFGKNIGNKVSSAWDSVYNYNANPTTYSYDQLSGLDVANLKSELASLQRGVDSGISVNDALQTRMDTLSGQINDLSLYNDAANFYNVDPSTLSQADLVKYQNYVDQNTGLTGFVNNTFGGWGNLFSGLQGIGSLYMGLQNIGLMKDQLSLAQDQFNFNKEATLRNFANQEKQYDTALEDRMTARAKTQYGDEHALDDKIAERKLSKDKDTKE